jgi:tetratricopeptide (TPR) repeat protein
MSERRPYSAGAELARFAGWAAFDAGRHVQARRYWHAGLRAAHHGGDPGMFAYLLSNLALQAVYAGDGRTAINLLEVARERAGTASSLTVLAMLDAWQVRAHAAVGEGREAARLLSRADELWECRVPDDDPAWIYLLTQPSLTAEAGLAFLALGQAKVAEQLLSEGLEALPPDSQRDRILYLTRIASARLAQRGGVEGALEAAGEAVRLACTLDSARAMDQLHEFAARVTALHPGAPR